MISKRKQGDSEVAHIEFDVGLFLVESCQKDQAKKVLEEAAEVYAAWQDYDRTGTLDWMIVDECADVIQASMNLIYALGYEPFEIDLAMERCLTRNQERGRC